MNNGAATSQSKTPATDSMIYLGAAAFLTLLVVVVALSVAPGTQVLVALLVVAVPVVVFTVTQKQSGNDETKSSPATQLPPHVGTYRNKPDAKPIALQQASASEAGNANDALAGPEVVNPDLGLRLADWFCDPATQTRPENDGTFTPGPGRRTGDSVVPDSERGKLAGQVLASGNQEAISFFRDQNALAMVRNMKLGAHIPNTNPAVARTNWSIINYGKVWNGKFERAVDPRLIDNTPNDYF